MGFLHNGAVLPLAVQSRRGIVLAAVLSLVLLIALWNTFADGPYHLQSHSRPPPHPQPPPVPPPKPGSQDEKRPPAEQPGGGNAWEPPHQGAGADPWCAHHPDTSNIGVVMKTGATESFARLPTQFLTVLRCVDDFLVFSDMAQTVAGFPVHDSLDNVLEEAKEGNEDFDLYREQQACVADVAECTSGRDKAKAGWSLDKYKNIHMAEKTWNMMPRKDWYLFVDADTYVLWNSLVAWLGQLDPNEELYVGSVAYVRNFPFSHGGSGYVLSRAAMEAVVGRHPGVANKYDVGMKDECCGDYVFSKAAYDVANISVTNVVSSKQRPYKAYALLQDSNTGPSFLTSGPPSMESTPSLSPSAHRTGATPSSPCTTSPPRPSPPSGSGRPSTTPRPRRGKSPRPFS